MSDDDYVFDRASGERRPTGELGPDVPPARRVKVRDSVGKLLADAIR